jgi:DNA repair protein RadD
MSIVLRPYQAAAVDALRHAYRTGNRAPLFQLPTGGGKTVVFAEIIRSAKSRGRPVGVLVHRRELIRQACDKLDWAGVSYGVIAAGFDPNPDELVQVGSVQTVRRRLDTLPRFAFLIFDEAHHCRAITWQTIIEAQPQAKKLGVTATPIRLDGKDLSVEAGGIFDALICGPTVRRLIKDGFLSPAKVFVPHRKLDLTGIAVRAGDYVSSELATRIDRPEIAGDAIEQYRRHADHQPAIAFCATVGHAEHVASAFRAAGYQAACVHGDLNRKDRDRLIAGLGTGEVEVLASCDLITVVSRERHSCFAWIR